MNQSDLSILEREKIGIVLTYQKKKETQHPELCVLYIFCRGFYCSCSTCCSESVTHAFVVVNSNAVESVKMQD